MTTDDLKQQILNGELDEFRLASWMVNAKESQRHSVPIVIDAVTIERGIMCNDNALVLQWGSVFVQAWVKDQTLAHTLRYYKYPAGMPDLTKNVTKLWDLNRQNMKMQSRVYRDEFVDLKWQAFEGDDCMLFSNRIVVMPNDDIFQFD